MPFDEAQARYIWTPVLTSLQKSSAIETRPSRRHTAVVSHIHDLVAPSVGVAQDYKIVADERGLSAARLRVIKADIASNLGDCELNVNAIAARHRVTPRYVQKLFAR